MDYKTKQIQINTHIWNEYSKYEKFLPNSLIAIKIGDFYEFWGRAAHIVSELCKLTIAYKEIDTKVSDNNVAMVGIPAFALQQCCAELKKLGLSVDVHNLTTHSESFNDNVEDRTELQGELCKIIFSNKCIETTDTDMPLTLKECYDLAIKKGYSGNGVIFVLAESALSGEIFSYGLNNSHWEFKGTTVGYA